MTLDDLDHQTLDSICFMVIDFEGYTLKGQSIEPVEVGAMRIVPPGVIDTDFQVDELMCPPAGAALPAFFMFNTGIRSADVVGKPVAERVLADLDLHFVRTPHVIIAHNAHVEARILLRYAQVCPHIAMMPFIDTVALAQYLIPQLASHKLNSVAAHFGLTIPPNRHRALADVQLTCEIFQRMMVLWKQRHTDRSFYLLRRVAGIDTSPRLEQPSLFGEGRVAREKG